jgi:glutaredoxin
MRTARIVPLLALAVLLAACASSGSSTGERRSRSSSTLITAEDLETVQNLNAYDAINRLRPQWFQSRSPNESPVVHLNGARIGGVRQLNTIQANTLSEIRYRNGRDASTRYGTGYGGGVIELTSKG